MEPSPKSNNPDQAPAEDLNQCVQQTVGVIVSLLMVVVLFTAVRMMLFPPSKAHRTVPASDVPAAVNPQGTGTASAPSEEGRPAIRSSPLVRAARSQIGVTVGYDPAYRSLEYPGGDVPVESGVCTDVVVRALRDGLALDLQKLVHEDMQANFSRYPANWGLSRPDKNIDHRRVPNLQTYFKRAGWEVPVTENPADYLPGDLVTCTVGGKLPHIMIVSDRNASGGQPMVIHNIGSGTREEPLLFAFPITGHYRVK